MTQAGQGERPAEPAALLVGVYADHVDLAQRGVVHLGPVEAGHMAVPFRDEEARRVEPWFPFPQVQVVPGPAALFGMLGEGPAVQLQPLVLVPAWHEAAQRPARRERRLVQRLTQRATHLPEGTEALEPGRPGQRGGRGQITVRPEPQYVAVRRHVELIYQRPPESPPP